MKKEVCILCGYESKFLFTKYDWCNEFHFYKCMECQHVFVSPMPSIQDLNLFYNQEYYVSDFQQDKVRKKGEYVLPYIEKNDDRMVEIGCSYGYFLDFMKDHDFELDGFELSKVASESAIKKGHHVINVNIEECELAIKYGHLFMFDVLEHIRDPKKFVDDINRILNPKATIYFTVPNERSLEFRWFGKYWEWSSPPAHLHYFNFKSMGKFLKANGFEVEIIASFKGDSAGNIFFHMFDAFKRMLMYKLGAMRYGRDEFLRKKMEYNLSKKKERQYQKKEFSGLMGMVQSASKLLNVFDRVLRNKNNEPTLFVKAKKYE